MTCGYRGGYSMFYDAVKELHSRGVFDASEVSGFEDQFKDESEVDEMRKNFPLEGEFNPVAVRHYRDNIYIAAYEYGDSIYVEKIEILSGGFSSLKGHMKLNFTEFTYAEIGGANSWFREKCGKFARPTIAAESAKSRSGEEASSAVRPVFRRKVFDTASKAGTTDKLSNNINIKGRGRLQLPNGGEPQGRGRCDSIRHRDDWPGSLRQRELQSSDSGILPRPDSDKSGSERQEQATDSRDSKQPKTVINLKKSKTSST